ncbi:protein FAM43A-like [Anneissia japonica]|uniref:protein FAM43A-like n=1 Tax=Anneissia japonica TaxID=1529436 RepID=UPI0014256EFB|nr:protein FAM43A-like [Anneissia japonica]
MDVVANVFKRTKQKFTVTPEDPIYNIRYLGNVRTLVAKGEGCTESAVRKLWKKTNQGKKSAKIKLTISAKGLKLEGLNRDRQSMAQLYQIHRISHRCVDQNFTRVFCWVYRHERKHKQVELRVHAAICSKQEKAEEVFSILQQICNSSFADYKKEKRDRERITEQTNSIVSLEHLPSVPLRRRLNTRSNFLPPLETSRNAPKLGLLCEEDEDVEQDILAEKYDNSLSDNSSQDDPKQDFGIFTSEEIEDDDTKLRITTRN